MTKSLLTLTLGLVGSLAGTCAFAANSTGIANFTGVVNANTCPIDVIDPGSGSTGPINLGSVAADEFGTRIGTERGGREFALRIRDGASCGIPPGDTATVTFTSTHGNAGSDGKFYGIQLGGAEGVALAIKNEDGTNIAHGMPSNVYALDANGETRMRFNAKYISTSTLVAPGPVIANINFDVTLP